MSLSIIKNNQGRVRCAVLFLGLLTATSAGMAMAYDTGPALRLDFEGSKKEPVEEVGPAYESGPALRLDFQGKKKLPQPEAQGPAYDAAPALRMDFQGSRRPGNGS